MRRKRVLEMDISVWNLAKSYAAAKGISYHEAIEQIIKERLSKLSEVIKNV